MTTTTAPEAKPEVEEHHDHGHDHPPFLAHHFDTPEQQFDSGKLGMWLFLVTEILFFSGLFCAYAVYRFHHPEMFRYAHVALDTNLGAFNTGVLIVSSLTMAWAVRCAQLGQQKGLIWCLTLTLSLAGLFLGVKCVEYQAKWDHGLFPGTLFDEEKAAHYFHEKYHGHGGHGHGGHGDGGHGDGEHASHGSEQDAAPGKEHPPEQSKESHGGDHGSSSHPTADPHGAHAGDSVTIPPDEMKLVQQSRVFFGIYFFMTGLHAIHIIAGVIAIGWLLFRAVRNDFNSQYFGPVDYVGLYWHLVDLIWIYLFPLLYLIR